MTTIKTDYLVVGSGLTAAVLARLLCDQGKEVLVLERRDHIGGNVYDETHASGVRIHTYGPHLFRTNSRGIWAFVHNFAQFYDYAHEVATWVDGQLEAWPITQSYLQRTVGENWQPSFQGTPDNFEEASLAMMPRLVYEKFVRGYTQKQWGVDPKTLDVKLAKRFDVRADDERKLSRHRFQGMPRGGFTPMMSAMLDGIQVIRGVDYLKHRDRYLGRRKVIFTGPIDEYFGFEFGRLTYRGQIRQTEYLADVRQFQQYPVINFPGLDDAPYVRRIEWKHIMEEQERNATEGTVLTTETPFSPHDADQYEYPFPDDANAVLYGKYRQLADRQENVLFCGRLGEYRYLDMDQAIGRAFVLAQSELNLSVDFLDEESVHAIPQ